MKKNVILVDFKVNENWNFIKGIKESTNLDWGVVEKVSNYSQKNKLLNFKRYLAYFMFSLKNFFKRKKFNIIIAWQQFYGICLCWLLSIFKVKNGPKIAILTFIYKPKDGFKGKLYFKFVNRALSYKNILNVFVLSKYELEQYSNYFPIIKNKLVFVKLGIDNEYPGLQIKKGEYFISSGRSNRDYDFLVNCFKKINKKLIIVSDKYKNENITPNIKIEDSCFGKDYYFLLANSFATIISLTDIPISSGQLVVLDSFLLKKPVIATSNKGINDYVQNGLDGFIIEKKEESLLNAINELYDEQKYENIINNIKFYGYFEYGKEVGKVLYNGNK